MIKKLFKRIRVNFRQGNSDRKASFSYRHYHKQIALWFKKRGKNNI